MRGSVDSDFRRQEVWPTFSTIQPYLGSLHHPSSSNLITFIAHVCKQRSVLYFLFHPGSVYNPHSLPVLSQTSVCPFNWERGAAQSDLRPFTGSAFPSLRDPFINKASFRRGKSDFLTRADRMRTASGSQTLSPPRSANVDRGHGRQRRSDFPWLSPLLLSSCASPSGGSLTSAVRLDQVSPCSLPRTVSWFLRASSSAGAACFK